MNVLIATVALALAWPEPTREMKPWVYNSLYWVFDRYRFETVLPSPFGFPMPPGISVILR